MSRKKVNGKLIVRINKSTPSPYLEKHLRLLLPSYPPLKECTIMDLGCGNGRNSAWLSRKGANKVISIDQHAEGDYADNIIPCDLGQDSLPDVPVDVFLVNYVFMFLDQTQRKHLVSEIKRLAKPNARIMVELYKAVDGHAKSDQTIAKMQEEILEELGWEKIHWNKGKFIAENQLVAC